MLTIVGDLYDTFQLPERLPFNFSNGQAFTRADGNLYIFTDSAKLIGLSSLTGKWFSNEMPIVVSERVLGNKINKWINNEIIFDY